MRVLLLLGLALGQLALFSHAARESELSKQGVASCDYVVQGNCGRSFNYKGAQGDLRGGLELDARNKK
jgi:hypothetical protein